MHSFYLDYYPISSIYYCGEQKIEQNVFLINKKRFKNNDLWRFYKKWKNNDFFQNYFFDIDSFCF